MHAHKLCTAVHFHPYGQAPCLVQLVTFLFDVVGLLILIWLTRSFLRVYLEYTGLGYRIWDTLHSCRLCSCFSRIRRNDASLHSDDIRQALILGRKTDDPGISSGLPNQDAHHQTETEDSNSSSEVFSIESYSARPRSGDVANLPSSVAIDTDTMSSNNNTNTTNTSSLSTSPSPTEEAGAVAISGGLSRSDMSASRLSQESSNVLTAPPLASRSVGLVVSDKYVQRSPDYIARSSPSPATAAVSPVQPHSGSVETNNALRRVRGLSRKMKRHGRMSGSSDPWILRSALFCVLIGLVVCVAAVTLDILQNFFQVMRPLCLYTLMLVCVCFLMRLCLFLTFAFRLTSVLSTYVNLVELPSSSQSNGGSGAFIKDGLSSSSLSKKRGVTHHTPQTVAAAENATGMKPSRKLMMADPNDQHQSDSEDHSVVTDNLDLLASLPDSQKHVSMTHSTSNNNSSISMKSSQGMGFGRPKRSDLVSGLSSGTNATVVSNDSKLLIDYPDLPDTRMPLTVNEQRKMGKTQKAKTKSIRSLKWNKSSKNKKSELEGRSSSAFVNHSALKQQYKSEKGKYTRNGIISQRNGNVTRRRRSLMLYPGWAVLLLVYLPIVCYGIAVSLGIYNIFWRRRNASLNHEDCQFRNVMVTFSVPICVDLLLFLILLVLYNERLRTFISRILLRPETLIRPGNWVRIRPILTEMIKLNVMVTTLAIASTLVVILSFTVNLEWKSVQPRYSACVITAVVTVLFVLAPFEVYNREYKLCCYTCHQIEFNVCFFHVVQRARRELVEQTGHGRLDTITETITQSGQQIARARRAAQLKNQRRRRRAHYNEHRFRYDDESGAKGTGMGIVHDDVHHTRQLRREDSMASESSTVTMALSFTDDLMVGRGSTLSSAETNHHRRLSSGITGSPLIEPVRFRPDLE